MSRAMILIGVVAALFVQGCASCEPDENVSIAMMADANLNTYGEPPVPHKMDVYIFKVSDSAAFQSTPLAQLKGSNPGAPGAVFIGRKNISPGQTVKHRIGPMGVEMYEYVGVVGAYRQGSGTQVMVEKIPSSCDLKLSLGANGLLSFGED